MPLFKSARHTLMHFTEDKLSLPLLVNLVRPKTLLLCLSVPLLFVGVTDSHLNLALIALFGLLCQVTANIANDYFDGLANRDHKRAASAPKRITQHHPSLRPKVKNFFLSGLAFTVFLAIIILYTFSPKANITMMAILLAASIASCLLYSSTKWGIATHALGELFAFIFFGPLYALGISLCLEAPFPLLASMVVGLGALLVMLLNNLRDAEGDLLQGKKTLANLLCKHRYLLLMIPLLTSFAISFYLHPLLTCLVLLPAYSFVIHSTRPPVKWDALPYEKLLPLILITTFIWSLGFGMQK